MKNILSKVVATSMALTLALASAVTVSPSSLKAEEAPAKTQVKAPAAVQEAVKEEPKAEAKSETGILKAVEQKAIEEAVAEVTVIKAEPEIEKAAPEIVRAATVEEEAAPVIEAAVVEAAEEVAAPAPVIEETEAKEAEPVKIWDVSATENDNVSMKFYADGISVDKDVTTGEVVISGTGEMEEAVYTNFMSVDSYLTALRALFEKYYPEAQIELEYDEAIENVIDIDATVMVKDAITGQYLETTDQMRAELDVSEFLEFSPTKITINEGITSVSEYAFLACADVTEVILPGSVKKIAPSAFQYCTNLKTVVMHEDTAIENSAFYHCEALAVVEVADDTYYANRAQGIESRATNRVLTLDEVNALVEGETFNTAEEAPNPGAITVTVVPGSCDHFGGGGLD